MPECGYFLATEAFRPAALFEQARLAEQAGFRSQWISDPCPVLPQLQQ